MRNTYNIYKDLSCCWTPSVYTFFQFNTEAEDAQALPIFLGLFEEEEVAS